MNRDTCDICGISGDLEGHKCDPRKILKPVEDAEVQDWIKYRRTSSQTFKMLDAAEQLLLRLARENTRIKGFRDECEKQYQSQVDEKIKLLTRIEELEEQVNGYRKNVAFYQSCALSGEVPCAGVMPYRPQEDV